MEEIEDKNNSPLFVVFVLLVSIFTTSCTMSKRQVSAQRLSDTRLVPVAAAQKKIVISRKRYARILNNQGDNNKVRMIQIFRRGQAKDDPPEYRLLDVKQSGIFHYLGLRSRDVVLAANDFVIPNPPTFWEFVKIVPNAEHGNIEIRRNGKPVLLVYTFVD